MLFYLLVTTVWMAFLSLVQSTQFPCLLKKDLGYRLLLPEHVFIVTDQHAVKFKFAFVNVIVIVVLHKGFPQKSFAFIVISAVDG